MRIGLARIRVAGDRNAFDAVADHDVWHVQSVDEFREPRLEVHAVVEDQIGFARPPNVSGRRLVAVNFGPRLGDRLDAKMIAGNVLGDIRQHGERGEHHRAVVVGARTHRRTAGQKQGGEGGNSQAAEVLRVACRHGRTLICG